MATAHRGQPGLGDQSPAVLGCQFGVAVYALETLPRAQSINLLRKFRPDLPEQDPVLAQIAVELGDLRNAP